MKKVLLVFLPGIIFYAQSQAQIKDFDLSKYKLPYLKRQSLDFNFNANSNIQHDNNDYLGPSNIRNTSNFNGNLSGTYTLFYNSPNYQGTQTMSLSSTGGDNYSKDYNNNEQNALNLSILPNINSENRFYFNNLKFIESDVTETFNYYRNKSNDINKDSIYRSSNSNNDLSLDFKAGFGRIEPIEDARLAVYILDELSKTQKLEHNPSDEEILAFSKLISEVKNKRFFDARLRKIWELTQVDSFLRASNLIKGNDIRSFTIINDNWDYSSGPQRSSGWRYAIGIGPRFINSSNTGPYNVQSYLNNSNLFQGIFFGEFIYEKPISLYWQNSFNVNIGYTYQKSKNNNSINEFSRMLNTRATWGPGYYPNSRTYINFNIGGYLSYDTQTKYTNFQIGPGVKGYYYFSPQLRLAFHDNLTYNNSKTGTQRYQSIINNFNVQLVYSFF
jgi:hypothetical protein